MGPAEMDTGHRSRWRMVSADTAIERKRMMTSWEREVRCGFVVGKAVEVVEEGVVSFRPEHGGETAVPRRYFEMCDPAADGPV